MTKQIGEIIFEKMHSSLLVENIFDNLRITVNIVDNPKRKSFTESVNIRLRYVSCLNFFDEYATTMTKRFRITTIPPTKKIPAATRSGLKEVKEGSSTDKFVLFSF